MIVPSLSSTLYTLISNSIMRRIYLVTKNTTMKDCQNTSSMLKFSLFNMKIIISAFPRDSFIIWSLSTYRKGTNKRLSKIKMHLQCCMFSIFFIFHGNVLHFEGWLQIKDMMYKSWKKTERFRNLKYLLYKCCYARTICGNMVECNSIVNDSVISRIYQ